MIHISIFWFLLISSNIAIATSTPLSSQQTLYLEAEKAVKSQNWKKYSALLDQLQDYPLTNYLERDRLLTQLNLRYSDQIETFLNANGNAPVAKKLRYKWLHWLAKNNHSSLFLRHYRNFGSTQLKCKQLEFRLRTSESEADIYAQVKNVWLTGRSIPKACDKVISLWQKAGQLTDTLIWQRILLANKAKQKQLVRFLTKKLKPADQQAAELLVEVTRSPEKLLKVKFRTPLTERARDIVQTGLSRLAWKDPNQAIRVWAHLGKNYQLVEDFPTIKRAISLSLAIEKDPKATRWLSSLNQKQDQSVNQWLLSTALREKNWALIADLANQFSLTDHESYKWRYWQAVAETQLGNLSNAQTLFESLAEKRSYYGFLAARQLDKQPDLQHQAIDFTETELDQLTLKPAAKRAREFFLLGRLNDARREWNHLVRQTPHDQQTKLALIAHRWDWQHQAILAFARSKQINDVEKRFPLHRFQLFSQQAKRNQIPVSWAYAIARQESAFKTDAISSAGARGLMQLKHSTAKIAAKNRIPYRRASQLLSADTNIQIGTAHLSRMYQSFNAHPVLATAAYNAGKRRVQEWLQNSNTQDALQWIEQIPYKETREYVKNVLTYQLIYAQLTNQPDNFIAQIDNFPILNNNTATTSR